MAENRSKAHEAAALLRRAGSLLTGETSSQTVPDNNTSSSQSREALVSNSTRVIRNNHTSSVLSPAANPLVPIPANKEFQHLFAPYNTANNSSLVRQPPAKRAQPNCSCGPTRYFKPHDSWTHEFFCLANNLQRCVPTRTVLQKAGLGRRRIEFQRKDDPSQVKVKLEEAYPKLATGGVFELLRSSVTPRDLEVIEPPASGYSVRFLRDASGLGQAIAYVWPIQRDLDTTVLLSVPEGCRGVQKIGVGTVML